MEQEIAENVIRASTTDLYSRVYFLGPYARRVSFSSMQNRALNLVWALQITRRLTRGQHVAVVGGGLSGVTATAALLDQGYVVTMYEDGENVMHRQIAATHRYVHPTVNRWPERAVEETTAVPYFDWVSAVCSDVVAKVQAEWKGVVGEANMTFVPHVTVTGFTERSEEVGVQTETYCITRAERYSTVLVTSGFADEHYGDPRIHPGYWRPDNLEADIASPQNKNVRYLISGCGDGGLIDALRVVHRDFRHGRLIVDIARELHARDWPGLTSIAAAEASLTGAGLRTAIEQGSEHLMRTYEQAAREMPIDLIDRLASSLRRDRNAEFVTLLSRERNPYSPMSAPIHKLLIAHAMGEMLVGHRSRQVVEYGTDHVMVVPVDTPPSALGTVFPERLDGHVILRHGAQPNFRKFFSSDIAAGEDLMIRQKTLAANLDGRFWREGTSPLKTWPPASGFAKDLRKRHMDTAALVRRISGLPNGSIDLDDEGFLFLHPDVDQAAVEQARLPATVFGFRLKVVSESDFSPSKAKAAGAMANLRLPSSGVVRPGIAVVATLNGRLGPICVDPEGRLFALTAGHLAPHGHSRGIPVNDAGRTMVGMIVDKDEANDIAKVAIAQDVAVDPAYAGRTTITGLIDAHEAFGEPVYLERAGGSRALGYVSATRAAVYFRQPGSSRVIELRNVVRIRSPDPASGFASDGDSGVPVVSGDGRLLGIVVCNDDAFTYVLSCADFMRRHRLELLAEPRKAQIESVEDASELGLIADIIGRFAVINRRDQAYEPLDLGEPPEDDSPVGVHETESTH